MKEQFEKEQVTDKSKKFLFIGIALVAVVSFVIYITYSRTFADFTNPFVRKVNFSTLKVDESAYGSNVFDTSGLDFRPILDKNVDISTQNAIVISFWVGGAEDNNAEVPVYDIALQDLKVDCNLLSPYLKWKLYKNGEELSNGSLDYHFDTIKNGRLVLTPTQQELVAFNLNKNLYYYYQFYLWISDSCQEEDISLCHDSVSQDNLVGKKISGKVEVELYSDMHVDLIRTPSDDLDTSTCIIEE